MLQRGQRFQPRNYRDPNAFSSAEVNEFEKACIVEEHLRYQVFGTCVHLPFQVCDVSAEIQRLQVLFRVARRSHTEVGRGGFLFLVVQVFPFVQSSDLVDEILCVRMAITFGNEL